MDPTEAHQNHHRWLHLQNRTGLRWVRGVRELRRLGGGYKERKQTEAFQGEAGRGPGGVDGRQSEKGRSHSPSEQGSPTNAGQELPEVNLGN